MSISLKLTVFEKTAVKEFNAQNKQIDLQQKWIKAKVKNLCKVHFVNYTFVKSTSQMYIQ